LCANARYHQKGQPTFSMHRSSGEKFPVVKEEDY